MAILIRIPNIVTTKYLTDLNSAQKNKLIADMAGLLYYRALPLCRSTKQGLNTTQRRYEDIMGDLSIRED